MDSVYQPGSCAWTPINETGLQDKICKSLARLPEQSRALWQTIRLPSAEIWQQRPWADEGCGFWVVAIFGKQCIYFNDVTGGFAASPFKRWGNIDVFDKQAHDLEQLIEELAPEQRAIA